MLTLHHACPRWPELVLSRGPGAPSPCSSFSSALRTHSAPTPACRAQPGVQLPGKGPGHLQPHAPVSGAHGLQTSSAVPGPLVPGARPVCRRFGAQALARDRSPSQPWREPRGRSSWLVVADACCLHSWTDTGSRPWWSCCLPCAGASLPGFQAAGPAHAPPRRLGLGRGYRSRCSFVFLLVFKFKIFILRERACEWGRGAEDERERVRTPTGSSLRVEPDRGLDPMTLGL